MVLFLFVIMLLAWNGGTTSAAIGGAAPARAGLAPVRHRDHPRRADGVVRGEGARRLRTRERSRERAGGGDRVFREYFLRSRSTSVLLDHRGDRTMVAWATDGPRRHAGRARGDGDGRVRTPIAYFIGSFRVLFTLGTLGVPSGRTRC